jgi:hypothetical protein
MNLHNVTVEEAANTIQKYIWLRKSVRIHIVTNLNDPEEKRLFLLAYRIAQQYLESQNDGKRNWRRHN